MVLYYDAVEVLKEYFKELLKTSKKDFHEMFLRTYGLLYDKNSFIFKDMFDDLEKYYLTGGVDLTAALDNFFDRLYRKMFQVLNSQYTFNEMYMNCISQKMEELKPFGDVPKKLTVEVKRSFVATRTFVQALAIGRDVVKFIQEKWELKLVARCEMGSENGKSLIMMILIGTMEQDYSIIVLPSVLNKTATAGSDVVQSGRPIFDDFFQHLWPYVGNNMVNVVFQMVKRLWLIRIDQ
ncbi:glypican-6 [Trichonephila clavipes]|nr:glypican-6 [Trichonephila clavipes]